MAKTLKFGNKTWATKVGSTLAYNDENGNYKPLPFAFTRSTSATRVNKEGLIEVVTNDRPRIDYTDTSDGVLLLENAATNLIPYSEDFSVANWTKSNVTITSNSIISPDGTSNADKLVENSSIGAHHVYDTVITNSGDYSNSIFVKSAERSKIRINSGSNSDRVDFDLSNGTVISQLGATGNIVSVSNGWYKCDISWNTAAVAAQYFLISLLDDSGTQGYQGDGTSGVYIWGAQLEIGNASSYIPTQGSATTRVAETASGSGNSEVFNDSEGVLFADIAALADDSTNRQITLSDGTDTNRLVLKYDNQSNVIQVFNRVNGLETAFLNASVSDITLFNKCLLKYKVNDYALWINGFEVDTDIVSTIFPSNTLNDLKFGDGGSDFYGKTKELGYYDTILTDLELETLTSYKSWTSMVNELNLNIIYNG